MTQWQWRSWSCRGVPAKRLLLSGCGAGIGPIRKRSSRGLGWREDGRELKRGVLAWAVLLTLAVPTAAAPQVQSDPELTEGAAAAALMDHRWTPQRDRALRFATDLGPGASPELRAALIHAAWVELRGDMDRPDETKGEDGVIPIYKYAVARLRDPHGVPFLIEVLGWWGDDYSARALADFPNLALVPVLEGAADPVRGTMVESLFALRFMIKDGSLRPEQVAQIRELAQDRLLQTHETHPTHHRVAILEIAMSLAAALGDLELRRIVERIATDRATVEALLSNSHSPHPDLSSWVDRVQEGARDYLSGEDGWARPVPPPLLSGWAERGSTS